MNRDERIRTITEIYKQYSGRKSKTLEDKNTYLWRYATKFLEKMEKFEAPWSIIELTLYYLAKQKRASGINSLQNDKVIECSIEMAINELKKQDMDIQTIADNHQFALKHNFEFAHKVNDGGYPNLVVWYVGKQISPSYVALSKSCQKTMEHMDNDERLMLPDPNFIRHKRIFCIANKKYGVKVKHILDNELIDIISESL